MIATSMFLSLDLTDYIIIMGCFGDKDINVSFCRSHRSHIIIMGCFDDNDINVSFSRSHRSDTL